VQLVEVVAAVQEATVVEEAGRTQAPWRRRNLQ